MSYIDKITNKDTGESRVISPAAEAVRVSNENYEGENLDEVLDEIAEGIDGAATGTVKSVTINNTKKEPDETTGDVNLGTVITEHQDISQLATKTEVNTGLASKVDKNGTDSLMTAAEHTKLGNLPTATELATQMNAKANDNAVVKTISVNGGQAQTPTNGNVNISVSGGDVSKVKIGSTEYTPNSSGVVDISAGVAAAQPTIDPTTGNWVIGGTVSQYPSKGQDGNSGVASGDEVESVNNLNGGTTDTSSKVYVLGANQGKRLRDQMEYIYGRLQAVYNALGNIAFWDGKPSASALLPDLDWGAPKHAVAITNSLSNSVITRNGEPVSSSFQAEEGSTVTLIVAPANGYALTSVSYVKDGGSSTSATSLGDGTYKIEFVMGGSDVAITVSGTVFATVPITYGTPTHCAVPSGVTNPGVVASGGTANVQYECDNGYQLSAADITISGATIGAITHSGNVFTIPITHDGTSQSISITATASVPPMKLLRGYYIGSDIVSHSLAAAVTNAAVGNGSTVDVSKVVLTDYIHIDGDANSTLQDYEVNYGVERGIQQDSQQGPPCVGSFFRKQNGAYKLITSWSWQGNYPSRKVTASTFTSSAFGTALLEALQAGELYVRAALYLDAVDPAALVNTVAIKWGSTNNVNTLFSASSQFVISTDPTEFDSFTYDGAPQ